MEGEEIVRQSERWNGRSETYLEMRARFFDRKAA
jgi:hypothetical protein